MKILYHFRTQGTGAEGVHIAGLAQAFERLGHEVVFSSPSGIDPRQTAGANPFAAQRQRGWLARLAAHAPGFVFELLEIGYNFLAAGRLRAILNRERCDFIYERHAFFLCATAFLARQRGLPLVVEVNELAGDERVRSQPWLLPLARLADRLTFERAALIIVVSPHLQRRIAALGIPEEKILVQPNAVEETTLDAPLARDRLRAQLGLEEKIAIGFVGWFVPWHRLDGLLAEFARLAASRPQLRLVLIGDGPLAEALRTQAQALGVADRVLFTGAVSRADMPAYLDALDIAVVPQSNEYRSPIKVFEYMARGRAIVAPDTEPIAGVLQHGASALLFRAGDLLGLGSQLALLVQDGNLRSQLGARARELAHTRHTWTKNAESVVGQLFN